MALDAIAQIVQIVRHRRQSLDLVLVALVGLTFGLCWAGVRSLRVPLAFASAVLLVFAMLISLLVVLHRHLVRCFCLLRMSGWFIPWGFEVSLGLDL
jgi:hypothetical protein